MPTVGIPQPPPYKGQNDQFPLFSIQNPYCERLENFNNKGGSLNLRKGNDRFAWNFNAATYDSYPVGLFPFKGPTTTNLFLLVRDIASGLNWYDIKNGGSFTSPSYTKAAGILENQCRALYVNSYLVFFGSVFMVPSGGVGVQQYSEAGGFAANTYTWPAASPNGSTPIPFGGNVYKNRAYFKNFTQAYYMYAEIGAISGTVTGVDLTGIVSVGSDLYGIKSISVSEATTPNNLQSFIMSTGEILVYSGSYPNAANWQIVSRFVVSEPIYHDTMIDAKGDTFILTKTEILSLRNLYTSGYDKERDEGIGASIKNRWSQIMSAIIDDGNEIYVSGAYDQEKDRLIIGLPTWVDPVTGDVEQRPFQLIYDFDLGCWYEYHQKLQTDTDTFIGTQLAFYDKDSFVATWDTTNYPVNVMKLDTKTDYIDDNFGTTDTDISISYKIRSAPAPYDKFGVMITQGLELIMKSDIYNTMLFKLIGNLGADETEQQNLEPPAGVDGLVYKAFVDIGIEGNVVQWELTGDSASSSYGIQIFATNLWLGAPSGEGVQR